MSTLVRKQLLDLRLNLKLNNRIGAWHSIPMKPYIKGKCWVIITIPLDVGSYHPVGVVTFLCEF